MRLNFRSPIDTKAKNYIESISINRKKEEEAMACMQQRERQRSTELTTDLCSSQLVEKDKQKTPAKLGKLSSKVW